MEIIIIVHAGYRYRLYPTEKQAQLLDQHMFVSNQAYNICLNLQQKQWETNKKLPKEKRTYMTSSEMDSLVKAGLKKRNLSFKTVIVQQARMHAEKALKDAFKVEGRGLPNFKDSTRSRQSFTWSNQGYSLKKRDNPKYVTLRLMRENFKVRFHRDLPQNAHIESITISRNNDQYYVSFNLDYQTTVSEISKENLDISKAVGVDVNIEFMALSNGQLIETRSKEIAKKQNSKAFKIAERKQSRRIRKAKKNKDKKVGANYKKTRIKLNKARTKAQNRKKDIYHKKTHQIVNSFDLIVVEDLDIKKMTASAKGTQENPGKNVKAKRGLNRSISNTSFYQYISMLEYKAKRTGKLFIKVSPRYTSKTCSRCGRINHDLKLSDREFVCECGLHMHRDTNASINILNRGLESIGLGTSLTRL